MWFFFERSLAPAAASGSVSPLVEAGNINFKEEAVTLRFHGPFNYHC